MSNPEIDIELEATSNPLPELLTIDPDEMEEEAPAAYTPRLAPEFAVKPEYELLVAPRYRL